jgi:hypothetical protein
VVSASTGAEFSNKEAEDVLHRCERHKDSITAPWLIPQPVAAQAKQARQLGCVSDSESTSIVCVAVFTFDSSRVHVHYSVSPRFYCVS